MVTNIENKSKIENASCIILDQYSPVIPKGTMEKLLKKMERFEQSDLYLKNTICLLKLASYCGCNTKYVSHVLNFCKERDYNNYINELRIQYVVKKLKSDHRYRKYKIAVLAKEAGFSSPNKFSFIFKKFTGELPSKFIKNLQ